MNNQYEQQVLGEELELDVVAAPPGEYESIDYTDKIRWVRVAVLFAVSLVAYIVGSIPVRPPLILVTCAIAMVAGLLILRAWELFILACLLAAIDHLPMWLNPGMSTFAEPILLKLTKDIIAIGLLLAVVKIRPTVQRRFLITYVLFGGYLFLRALVAPGLIGLTGVRLRYLLFYPFLGMVFAGALNSIEKITKFLRILTFTGVIVVLFGLYEIVTYHRTYYSGYISFGPIRQRMVSTLGNPNNLALFLQLPFLYLMSGLFLKVTKSYRLFIPLFILGVGMFLTFSRTSFVMGLVGILCIAIMTRNFRAVALTSFLLVIGMVTLIIVYHGRASISILGTRLQLLIQFIAESTETGQVFLFGRGLGSGVISVAVGEEIRVIVTDNSFTGLLRQAGVIGLTLFILLLSELTLLCVKAGQQISSVPTRRLYITLMTWNTVFVLYALATPAFILYPTALIYWVSIFWTLTLPELETTSSEEYLVPAYYEADYDDSFSTTVKSGV